MRSELNVSRHSGRSMICGMGSVAGAYSVDAVITPLRYGRMSHNGR